jgi:hypothetical protein
MGRDVQGEPSIAGLQVVSSAKSFGVLFGSQGVMGVDWEGRLQKVRSLLQRSVGCRGCLLLAVLLQPTAMRCLRCFTMHSLQVPPGSDFHNHMLTTCASGLRL